jgi:hypothetical protein
MQISTCPVCDSPVSSKSPDPTRRDTTAYACPLCGNYSISGTAEACLPNALNSEPDASAKISHAIRRQQKNGSTAFLNSTAIEAITTGPLPRPREQADLFIRWLAQNSPGPGESVWVEPKHHMSIIGAKSAEGFALVIDHLFDIGQISGNKAYYLEEPGRADVKLTFAGWDHYETLKLGGADYKKAFMAMKFGDPILEGVVSTVFKPSALRAGFQLYKLNETPRAGLIDDRLRVEIQSSDFIIADLTHDNQGAYWEAGYAEGLGKPVIYTCEKEKFEQTKTHFDTNHHLTVIWSKDNPMEAGVELTATIRATLPHIASLVDPDV